MKPVNSYQSGMIIPGESKIGTNGVYYATEKEAWEAGKELMSRWFIPSDHTMIESDKAANYRFDFEAYKSTPIGD